MVGDLGVSRPLLPEWLAVWALGPLGMRWDPTDILVIPKACTPQLIWAV